MASIVVLSWFAAVLGALASAVVARRLDDRTKPALVKSTTRNRLR